MMFITHDLSVASQICSEVAVMYRGSVVETGPPDPGVPGAATRLHKEAGRRHFRLRLGARGLDETPAWRPRAKCSGSVVAHARRSGTLGAHVRNASKLVAVKNH